MSEEVIKNVSTLVGGSGMSLCHNWKITYAIYLRFKDNNIKLLDYIFYMLIVMFGFMFKNEKKIMILCLVYIFVTRLKKTKKSTQMN